MSLQHERIDTYSSVCPGRASRCPSHHARLFPLFFFVRRRVLEPLTPTSCAPPECRQLCPPLGHGVLRLILPPVSGREREKKSSGMTEPRGGRGKRAGIHIKGARAGGKNRARCELVVWLAAEWGSLWTQHLWICIHYLCSAAPEPPRLPSSPPNRDWRVRLRVVELSQGVIG